MKKSIILIIGALVFNSCGVVRTENAQCEKEELLIQKKLLLPSKIDEMSGLEQYKDYFLGFNDSGGAPEIYMITKENPAKIVKTIQVENASNVDWEDIAVGDSLIFVGDFGNNVGNRKDLKIYYFPKKLLDNDKELIKVKADTISFFYPEQQDYNKGAYKHDYDLEAMFYHKGKLHLFTKQWDSLGTAHYTLDIVKGKQPACLVETLKTDFLITAADAKTINNLLELAFVGYTRNGQVFLLKGTAALNTPKDKWLKEGKFKLYKIGFAGRVGQVEGVSIVSENEVCYSAERYKHQIFNAPQNITCVKVQ